MRSEQEVSIAIDRYSDTVKRLCVLYLKNHTDTEDVFQTVFLKYALSTAAFESPEHEKAWIIRVTINACKDWLKWLLRHQAASLDELLDVAAPVPSDHREVLEAVLSLPQKYKDVIYLHFYEGCTAPEIGRILGKNINTVYTLINRGKELLRKKLEQEGYHGSTEGSL